MANPVFPPTIGFFSFNNPQNDSTPFLDLAVVNQTYDCKSHSGMNDKARSMGLLNVPAGVVICVYDDPGGSTSDDWCEITVLRNTPAESVWPVNTFEQTQTDEYVSQVFHRNNGLDGKVSFITVAVAAPPRTLDYAALGALLNADGWNDKGGSASSFTSQDSQYRMYQPLASALMSDDGKVTGTQITAQIDHIRGSAADDHCYVVLQLTTDNQLSSSYTFAWGSDSPSQGAQQGIQAVGDLIKGVADLCDLGDEAGACLDCLKAIYKVVAKLVHADDGGRVNFNAVVNHCINKILQSTRASS